MKRLIIAVLAASTASVVYAHAETDGGKDRNGGMRAEIRALIEGDGMKVEDLQKLLQDKAEARFKELDADANGILTKDEYTAATAERAKARFEQMSPDENGIVKRAGRNGKDRTERQEERRADLFARLDADKDGSISREEFDAGMKARDERVAERGDMRGKHRHHDRAEHRGEGRDEMRGMHREMRSLMREGMTLDSFTELMQKRATARFEALDKDGKGEVSVADFTSRAADRAERMFARMDRNDDGVVTKDDRPNRGDKHRGPRSEN